MWDSRPEPQLEMPEDWRMLAEKKDELDKLARVQLTFAQKEKQRLYR